tara:strand:+ start:284 stop:490 length:207 start_codon:yes stop_codon:yes gene_type:complete
MEKAQRGVFLLAPRLNSQNTQDYSPTTLKALSVVSVSASIASTLSPTPQIVIVEPPVEKIELIRTPYN